MKGLLHFRAGMATDPGTVHTVNADSLCIREPSGAIERVQKGWIWVIADGIGANEAALQCSRLAARAIVDEYWESAIPDPAARLRSAVQRTNALLATQLATGSDGGQAPGATALAALAIEDRLYVAHVGRSRAYLLRDGDLRQLTADHTWVADEIRAGRLAPEAAATHPHRNLITRCLGVEREVEVDLIDVTLQPDDVILLCSDGLSRHVTDEHIALALARAGADAAPSLVEEARRLGGQDNVTAVTIAVGAAVETRASLVDRVALVNRLGRELTTSLDPDATAHSVIQQLLTLTGGDRAALLLRGPNGALMPMASHHAHGLVDRFNFSSSVAEEALRERRPILIENALDDPRFSMTESIVDFARRSILCVPLIVQADAIGVLYVDSSTDAGIFDQTDLDLLVSFASQAAAAIQNARLHQALLERTRDLEIARRRQESLLRSLSSALIATDNNGRVTHWNPAAEQILGIPAREAIGLPLPRAVPPPLASWLTELMVQSQLDSHTVLMGHEWEGQVGGRDRVILAGRVAQIHDPDGGVSGFVFVINDRTDLVLIEEARRVESTERHRMRELLTRYMAPAVVERLLQSPEANKLGGSRQDITVLFADVRGFTGFSERHPPEEVVAMLNRHLALAVSEVFRHLGTVDKFLGDGVMAIFGAPLAIQQHPLAAVHAALAMCARLRELQEETGLRSGFGIGVNSGQAIVGNIGTDERLSYTAIGDVVNVAARLQSEARSGEILISDATLAHVASHVEVEELGPIYVKGRTVPVNTYKVLRMVDALAP